MTKIVEENYMDDIKSLFAEKSTGFKSHCKMKVLEWIV